MRSGEPLYRIADGGVRTRRGRAEGPSALRAGRDLAGILAGPVEHDQKIIRILREN